MDIQRFTEWISRGLLRDISRVLLQGLFALAIGVQIKVNPDVSVTALVHWEDRRTLTKLTNLPRRV